MDSVTLTSGNCTLVMSMKLLYILHPFADPWDKGAGSEMKKIIPVTLRTLSGGGSPPTILGRPDRTKEN